MSKTFRLRAAVGAGALLIFGLAACGGGGGSAPPTVLPTVAPTIAPAATHQINVAPISSTPTTASLARNSRGAQALTVNNVPAIVEASGMRGLWPGSNVVWVTDTATTKDVAETSATATSDIAIDDPSMETLACTDSSAAPWCAAHPSAWFFGTHSANGKPVGQHIITITFGDGTVGTEADDVFDGWLAGCNSGVTYTSGAPAAGGTSTTADWYADCNANAIDFPHGATLVNGQITSSTGSITAVMATVTSASVTNPVTSVPFANIALGSIYAVKLGDGGIAKVFFDDSGGNSGPAGATGMSLHDNPSGSGTFKY